MKAIKVFKCDKCGREFREGNRPDGLPNGVCFKNCKGLNGADLTMCADCIIKVGKEKEEARNEAESDDESDCSDNSRG